MKKNRLLIPLSLITCIGILVLFACSKSGSGSSATTTTTNPGGTTDPCAGKTITLSATATQSDACGTGVVTVTAAGSTGFTYSIDGTNFQVSNIISNVAPGLVTITVKDGAGCSKTTSVTVVQNASGPLFAAVKTMMQTNCFSCHSGASANGGKDFTIDCVIASSGDRIKARAVDGNPSFMPQGGQLSTTDKKKITDWINAGGRYSD